MPKLQLSDILQFTELLNTFTGIKRVCYIPKTNIRENDVEHSYGLAILAWYIAENSSIVLDKNLVLKYALIHDLVEVYAGDTYLYSENQNDHDSKKEREESARLRILEEFPLFKDLHKTILDYEKREDEESRFVYVLDKIHPVIQMYLDNGRMWKEQKVTLAMLIEKKADKALLSTELLPYWDELLKLLTESEDKLFHKK
ncbi:MAG: HD domain-containing protein [Candidatus Paceibacterota bacterium]